MCFFRWYHKCFTKSSQVGEEITGSSSLRIEKKKKSKYLIYGTRELRKMKHIYHNEKYHLEKHLKVNLIIKKKFVCLI